MYELVYTSTPTGLIAGRSGFTTVALTEGFPPNLIAPVENLSGYKPFFPPGSEHENRNPVNFTCQQFRLGRTPYIVLSKISYAGLSYTGRSNVLAHHLLFSPEELDDIPGGAVSVLRSEDNFPPWSGDPRMLPIRKKAGHQPLPQGGSMWQKLAGDSRWAQYMADCFHSNPEKGFAFSFDPLQHSGAEILELAAEMAGWMSKEDLRHFTFSTYCYSSQMTNPLFLRSYVKDSVQLASIKRLDPKTVIYLGTGNVLPASWQAIVSPADEKENEILPEQESQSMDPALESPEPLTDIITDLQPVENADDPDHHQDDPDLTDRTESHSTHDSDQSEAGPSRPINKKYIILPMICMTVLCLISAVTWRIFTGNHHQKTNLPKDNGNSETDIEIINSDANIRTEEKSPAAKKPRDDKSTAAVPPISQPGRPESGKKSKKPDGKPLQKPARESSPDRTAASAQPKDAAVPKVKFGRLSARDYLELYRGFYSGRRIKLPKALRDSVKMDLTLRSIGGIKDIKDLKEFISSPGKSVTVYSYRVVTSGIRQSCVPDKDPSGQMNFQLSDDGSLTIRLPSKKDNNVPQIKDISQIKFISSANDIFTFDTGKLPAGIDKILNKGIEIEIKDEIENFCFYLHVSDDLWAFRKFYTISVNGRSLGEIAQRDIPLHNFSQSLLNRKTEERNNSLKKLLHLEKEEQRFKAENRKWLKEPRLMIQAAPQIKEKLKAELMKTKLAAMRKDQNAWEKHIDGIRQILQDVTNNNELSRGSLKILMDIDDFKEKYQTYLECQAQLAAFREKHKNSLEEFQKKNSDLIKTLNNVSPALFRAAKPVLERDDDPRIFGDINAFYKKIPKAERLKDIKVEIIRRNAYE